MGFRDMDLFNRALVGKQVWRLLVNDNLVVQKVMKVKYFPRCGLLEAQVGGRASFVWRSLHVCINVVREDVCWMVGDGVEVGVWTERWVPGLRLLKPFGLVRKGKWNLKVKVKVKVKVKGLICEGEEGWNVVKIRESFEEAEAQAILENPLCRWGRQDQRIWLPTEERTYTVRSGYLALKMRERERDEEERSVHAEDASQFRWRWIWEVHIPPKVKHFCWKMCNGSSPTMETLSKRRVVTTKVCPRCGEDTETGLHANKNCKLVSGFWLEWKEGVKWRNGRGDSPREWLTGSRRTGDAELFEQGLMFAWAYGTRVTRQ